MEDPYKLKKEYSASGVFTFIADEELKILWKNNTYNHTAAEELLETGKSADIVFGGVPDTGLISREINGQVCTFNVIKRSEGERSYYIIELIASRSIGGTFSADAVRGYIRYICAKIRVAAGEVTSVTDRLFNDISEGTFNKRRAAEGFDRIYESVALLEREAVYPDRIYSLIDSEKPDNIIILDREMTAVAAGLKVTLRGKLGSRVRISEDYDRDIFFRMNADSFETAVASMTAECCGGECYPERIIISARRSGRNRAEVAVMSLDISGSLNGGSGGAFPAYESERNFNKRLLAEYIYDVLGLKNGARFSRERFSGGFVFRMNFEVLPSGTSVFAEKPVDGSGRRYEIADKLAFFFGDIHDTEGKRYTSRDFGDNDEHELVQNIYREDIENEKSEV